MKKILDVTCGMRSMWFNKQHPLAVYCDCRNETWESFYGSSPAKRTIQVCPDVVCNFTDLPFESESFSLVVFDPPHVKGLSEKAWIRKTYGSLDENWRSMIRDGFKECMRVLKPDGVLIFKWAETQISTRDVIDAIGEEPLFGHRSGKKMNTHWLCFMKQSEDLGPDSK
jgi:ubiquinone/menaquinone biosynthesis C-methylase UbiE